MNVRTTRLAAVGIAVVLSSAMDARADLIFSNFDASTGWAAGIVITPNQPATEYEQAMKFTPGVSCLLDAIVVPVCTFAEFGSYTPTPPPGTFFGNSMQVAVYADDNGHPGALLEMVDAPDSLPYYDGQGPIPAPVSTSFSGTAQLQAGQAYWVGLIETESTALAWLFQQSMPETPRMSRFAGGSEWFPSSFTRSGLQVYGTPLPAPAGLAVLGGMLLVSRRRRQA